MQKSFTVSDFLSIRLSYLLYVVNGNMNNYLLLLSLDGFNEILSIIISVYFRVFGKLLEIMFIYILLIILILPILNGLV